MKLNGLYESMRTIDDLGPYVISIADIGEEDGGGGISVAIIHQKVIEYWNDPENIDYNTRKPFVELDMPGRLAEADIENYGDYWTIHPTAHVKGWGPLVYEIGIEYATQNGKGLVPATAISKLYGLPMSDTQQSANIWDKFYKRADVRHEVLTDIGPPYLYCVYTKPPEILKQLEATGKLIKN